MKWIPLSERKPDWFICTTYEHFTDGRTLYYQDSIPEGATHWLEFELPPLPNTKDNNRHHLDKNLYLIQSKLERLDESTEAGDAHLLNRIIDLENKFDNLEERHSNLLENFIKWICRFSKLIDKP